MKDFNSLSEREILALAIFLEEEDERIYADLAEGLRENFPGSAEVFDGMREEESGHRRRPDRQAVRRWAFPVPVKTRLPVYTGAGRSTVASPAGEPYFSFTGTTPIFGGAYHHNCPALS